MFISKKKHNEILKGKDFYIEKQEQAIKFLEKELEEAKNLKEIVEQITKKRSIVFSEGGIAFNTFYGGVYDPLSQDEIELKLSENHKMSFVADELSENDVIIKQKSTKVIFLDKEGNQIKKGWTKQKPDKGYNYKLVRE